MAGPAPAPRVQSIDALRGFVMIIMALDHTREFFHAGAFLFQPEDLTRTTTAIFLTRWITHICAPVFMFTAGLGAYFWWSRGHTKAQLSRFLWTRGLWLVVLELTVLRFAMDFRMSAGLVLLSVLWALGWSMVALGFLIYLPVRVLAVVSIAVIALHNLTDKIQAAQFGGFAWIWNILHQLGVFEVGGVKVLSGYPLVPWIFVMAMGFCFGRIVQLDAAERRRWMTRIGLALTIAFLVLRGLNVYGDPTKWSAQVPGTVVLSFLRCIKYPPSLDFLLMTLGPALLIMSWLDRIQSKKTNPLIVFGRVPLFYFLGHFILIHALANVFAWIRYGKPAFLLNPLPSLPGAGGLLPPGYGYDLWVVYGVWASVVIAMYPVCLWFAKLKERNRSTWLSYL